MKKIVIMPGGFHPFHAGHMALYNAARAAFPSAEVYVAATTDTSTRPFPFRIKKMLAQAAGVPANRFIEVKSPFRAQEITQFYDPNETQLIFVRSDKDRGESPQPGTVKRDGDPGYLQPYRRSGMEPMSRHGYMVYLPVATFGPGMTSATEIRAKWPEMDDGQKISLVQNLYPGVIGKDAAAAKLVEILDSVMAPTEPPVKEAILINDPDAGLQIQPAGGMGTWDEASLVSNLSRKFADLINMVKNRDYGGLYHALYRAGATENMVRALAELEAFQKQQGRRPVARGREINTTDLVDEDYAEEK